MADSLQRIAIEKLEIKKEYDDALSRIEQDEYDDVSRMEENIRVTRYNFETKWLNSISLLKAAYDKAQDPKQKAALQNEIQDQEKRKAVELRNLEGIWKKQLGDLKQKYEALRNNAKRAYEEGYLKLTIREKALEEAEKKKKKEIEPGLLITRTRFPKWWKDLRVSGITIVGSGVQTIVQGGSNYNVFIASITVLTTDATSVSFGFGTMGASGPMPLGDTDQPKGMTISMSDSPAPCGQGGFTVHSIGGTGTLGGFVVYYVEKVETP